MINRCSGTLGPDILSLQTIFLWFTGDYAQDPDGSSCLPNILNMLQINIDDS